MMCPICPEIPHQSTPSISEIYKHVKQKHLKIKKKCPYCDRLISFGRPFECHIKREHGRFNYSETALNCDKCNYSTNLKSHLKRHIRVSHLKEKRHVCQHCDKRFEFPFALKDHIELWHVPDREKNWNILCEFCNKRFKFKSRLDDHNCMRPKTLECKICSLKFIARRKYETHYRVKHGSKPPEYENKETFMCEFCCKVV